MIVETLLTLSGLIRGIPRIGILVAVPRPHAEQGKLVPQRDRSRGRFDGSQTIMGETGSTSPAIPRKNFGETSAPVRGLLCAATPLLKP
jgi:hypothetical protein